MPPARTTPPPVCDPRNPLIVQSDRSILAEAANPLYPAARDAMAPFAELEKSPEHLHTWKITSLSLWNAAAAGLTALEMVAVLRKYTKFPIPPNILTDIQEIVSRYGRIRLERIDDATLRLICTDAALLEEVSRQPKIKDYLQKKLDGQSYEILAKHRGVLKLALLTMGYPAEDLAGYVDGADLEVTLRETTGAQKPFVVRDYQRHAADIFYAGGGVRGGSGVIVLPCGAGKTIVGIATMALVQKSTLVLTTGVTAVKQWRREILDKTMLKDSDVTEYTGETKEIGPVTIATYQIITWRADKTEAFPHFDLFDKRDWGLIIYDEVHLLPAPVFRVTAQIQARRRLGLTATLVREDGREGDVFSLIGPKKFDVPWRDLESQGWIATARCTEIRIPLPSLVRMEYALAEPREKFRIASENPLKEELIRSLLKQNDGRRIIVIGQYLKQLRSIAKRFDMPIITGQTPIGEREELYQKFRTGEISRMVLSKVGNFAIDLPDASVLIQVSGTFGSRQEEAQRLGRVLRPKSDGEEASFYTLVTRDTVELDFSHHRQMFLTEQGYTYEISDEGDSVMWTGEPERLAPPDDGDEDDLDLPEVTTALGKVDG